MWHAQGHFAEAQRIQERSLSIVERALDPNHPITALNLISLAGIYDEEGKYKDAEPLLLKAIKTLDETLGSNQVCHAFNQLASIYRREGRLKEAETSYKRAISVWKSQWS